MNKEELWLPVPIKNYNKHYEVSSLGRLRRLTPGKGGRYPAGRFLTLRKSKSGHLQVCLSCEGKYIYPLVHRLVLIAFRGPQPRYHEGCHRDGIPSNNDIDNLRWGTRQQNVQDALGHGTFPLGSKRSGAKLTEERVLDIRKRSAAGEKGRNLAKEYGVSEIVVSFAINRKTWKHI